MYKLIRIWFILLLSTMAGAQTDSLIFSNGDYMIGEIKSLNRGVIIVSTDYSDSDFKIEWGKVAEIYTDDAFIVTLSSGDRLTSSFSTDPTEKARIILSAIGQDTNFSMSELVAITEVEEGFLQRLSASIDLGFSLTKANNLRQFSLRSGMDYLTNTWSADASLDIVRSSQDDVDDTKRTDATIGATYFLIHNWYALASANFLQNDEQKLKLRATPKIGIGNFLVQTNLMYWGVYVGAAWNNETYTDPTIPNRRTAEANIGTELNLFNMGDLSLLTNLQAYKSISEGNRFRADFKIDVKYDLPLDFYIKFGYTHNYDNQPVEGASENDYVFQTTFGWEL